MIATVVRKLLWIPKIVGRDGHGGASAIKRSNSVLHLGNH